MKFSFRKKHFYPLMLLLFIFLRIVLDKILKIHNYRQNVDFIISFLIFFSQCILGFIIRLYYSRKNRTKEKNGSNEDESSSNSTIELLYNPIDLPTISDRNKIMLFFFASFFNFIGSIIRSNDVVNFGTKEENNSQLEVRVRSIQIISSSLLCYFTIRINIYKHQKVSLIIISFFLFVLIITELVVAKNVGNKILSLLICALSCIFRSFLDVIEKYLFEINYINIFNMLIFEGIIGVILYIFYFLSSKEYKLQGKNIINEMSDFDWDFISFILLIILYIIISGFRNAYRVATTKYYSPMSRALFESTLDPFLFLYNSLVNNENRFEGYWTYFSIVIICLTIIAFFSLVYNDFIILYCCGLERNTYKGITKRLYSNKIEKNSKCYEDDNDNENSLCYDDEEKNKDNEISIEMKEKK